MPPYMQETIVAFSETDSAHRRFVGIDQDDDCSANTKREGSKGSPTGKIGLRLRRRKIKSSPTLKNKACPPSPQSVAVEAEETKSQKQMPKSRKVSFCKTLKFRKVRPLDDYDQEDREQIWYADYEMVMMRQDCLATVRAMTGVEEMDKADFCPRGLEYKTPKGATIRRRNKQAAIQAVLREQTRQHETGAYDDELMRYIYAKANSPCQSVARMHAFIDAQDAHRYVGGVA